MSTFSLILKAIHIILLLNILYTCFIKNIYIPYTYVHKYIYFYNIITHAHIFTKKHTIYMCTYIATHKHVNINFWNYLKNLEHTCILCMPVPFVLVIPVSLLSFQPCLVHFPFLKPEPFFHLIKSILMWWSWLSQSECCWR